MSSVRFLECLANFISFTGEPVPVTRSELYRDENGHATIIEDEEMTFLSHSPSRTETASLSDLFITTNDADYDSDEIDNNATAQYEIERTSLLGCVDGRRRRMSSIGRVASRWRLSVEDAAEICAIFEDQQSSTSNRSTSTSPLIE